MQVALQRWHWTTEEQPPWCASGQCTRVSGTLSALGANSCSETIVRTDTMEENCQDSSAVANVCHGDACAPRNEAIASSVYRKLDEGEPCAKA